ncbi:MAG: hypothetical protein ACOX83_05140 [Candidatus Spyradocola sp.]
MRRFEDCVPAGLCARKEAGWIASGYALSALWSLGFLLRYFTARSSLFQIVNGKKVLWEGAKIDPFPELLDSALLGFAAVAIAMVLLALWHLLYHYQGSRSIDLMRRLPRKGELPLRCLALPLAGAIGAGALAALLYGIYFAVYRLCTPAAALPGLF